MTQRVCQTAAFRLQFEMFEGSPSDRCGRRAAWQPPMPPWPTQAEAPDSQPGRTKMWPMNFERTHSPPARASWAGLLALMLVAGCGTQQGESLSDRRKALNDGSAPGIVLIPARAKDAGTSPAPATPSDKPAASVAPVPAAAAKGTAGASAESRPSRGLFDNLPPPSGRSMNSAKDLKAPDLGIALPSNKAASQPAGSK
jgi:hypothetical protein